MAKAGSATLSAEERAAVKARARELKNQATLAAQAEAFTTAIAEMTAEERAVAEGLHALIGRAAPGLHPKTMYGMPAWANADNKVICFYQAATKYKTRYSTFGFQPEAQLDDGEMWETAFALTALSPASEKKIAALVKKAAGS